MSRGEKAAGKGGEVLFREDAGFVKAVQRAGFGGMVLAVEHDGVGFGAGKVGVAGQICLRKGPEGKRSGSRAGDKVPKAGQLIGIEVVDFQQLLHRRVSAQLLPVTHYFAGKIRADTGKGQKRRAVCPVDVQQRNVYVGLQTLEDGIRHHKAFGKV